MALAGKTVLVTGATGFLGGALVMRLAAEDVRIKALARRPKKGDFLAAYPNVEIVPGDITDADRMREVTKGCDLVFHAAASTGGPLAEQRKMNTDGTRNVATAAAEAGVQRLVHVSTISIYGYNQKADVSEDTPPTPSNDPYAITKLEAETVLCEIAARHNLDYSILRPGQIYGPRSGMWTGQLFKLARFRPTPFVGDGSGSVFAIFVDDVLDLMLALAEHPAAVGQAFNCTPDPSPTWREFLGAYARLAGHQSWLPIPFWLVYPVVVAVGSLAQPQTQTKELPSLLRLTQRRITFRNAKARQQLGWQPKVDLHTGVERCAPWLREQGLLA